MEDTNLKIQKRLSAKQLFIECSSETIKQNEGKLFDPHDIIVGQERAVKALKLGVGVPNFGFNMFVTGTAGTGKLRTVQKFLKNIASKNETPGDWCYVNNFKNSYHPGKLMLPAGMGTDLKRDMKKLIDEVQNALLKVFESEDFIGKRKEIIDKLDQEQNKLFDETNARFEKENWQIRKKPFGYITVPLKRGKPMTDEAFDELNEGEKQELREKQKLLQEELKETLREARLLEKEANKELLKLDREVTSFAINALFEELKEKYSELIEVVNFIEEARADVFDNVRELLKPEQKPGIMPGLNEADSDYFLNRYEVNVLTDNSETNGAPVIVELNPNYSNLFGKVERESKYGALVTDFTLIRQGALHKANGGYLLIPAEELLRNMFSWDGLKRAIRNREVVIEEVMEQMGFISTKTLKPEPISLKVKVILVGSPLLYHLLFELDDEFRKLFKVKADFDTVMDRSDENLASYILLLKNINTRDNLKNLSDKAIARIVEHGSRLADDQEKLSTRFGEIMDILREANYYAEKVNSEKIDVDHVVKAIEEKFFRSNLIRDKLLEMMKKNILKVSTDGEMVGQVNGLTVSDLGDVRFGLPTRITATINLGSDGILAIEREAELSGPIHTKGVLILSGYLSEKYFQDKPLSLTARLVFEQSYGEVEGDSASSTELYTLLSCLAGLPIKQGIAVTGSVNQKGEVQAIGGVNEKIEGFFEVCKSNGLTGKQGVVIPESNTRSLMLKEDVRTAVENDQFHIWAVNSIDEGIEILTGVKAGKQKPDGLYEKGSVSYLVSKKIDEFVERMKEFSFVKEFEAVKELAEKGH